MKPWVLASARVPRAGERVLAIANFSWESAPPQAAMLNKRLFRHDAETNTQDARAPQR